MKTHQEKLNELTTEIRKAIPRLMELSEGCEIKTQSGTKYKIYLEEESFYNCFNEKVVTTSMTKPLSTHSYTIIGHEPLLNDVLEWLKIKGIKISDTTDDLLLCFGGYKHYSFWDLSKLKLSDQSPELINFLHDLIK